MGQFCSGRCAVFSKTDTNGRYLTSFVNLEISPSKDNAHVRGGIRWNSWCTATVIDSDGCTETLSKADRDTEAQSAISRKDKHTVCLAF